METTSLRGAVGSSAHAVEGPGEGEDQLMGWFHSPQRSSTAWCRIGDLMFGAVEHKEKVLNISTGLSYDSHFA